MDEFEECLDFSRPIDFLYIINRQILALVRSYFREKRTRCTRSWYLRASRIEAVIRGGYVKRTLSPPSAKYLRAVCSS